MAYKLLVSGIHSADLPQESVKSFSAHTETPRTSDGRGVDTAVTLNVSGVIRSVDENAIADETINLAKWATEYDDAKAYSEVAATAIASGQVLRNVKYPQAFVVGYREKFDITKGVGTYDITLRQKKDLLNQVQVSGGFTD